MASASRATPATPFSTSVELAFSEPGTAWAFAKSVAIVCCVVTRLKIKGLSSWLENQRTRSEKPVEDHKVLSSRRVVHHPTTVFPSFLGRNVAQGGHVSMRLPNSRTNCRDGSRGRVLVPACYLAAKEASGRGAGSFNRGSPSFLGVSARGWEPAGEHGKHEAPEPQISDGATLWNSSC